MQQPTSGQDAAGTKVKVPARTREFLHDIAVHILRNQPDNLEQSVIDFLTMRLSDKREASSSRSPKDSDDDDILAEPPTVVRSVSRRRAVAGESFDPEKPDTDYVKEVHPKTDTQAERLRHATQNIILFRCLDEDQMKDIIDAMFERRVGVGETVIQMGDDGDNFYVIESGVFDIYVKIGGAEKCVGNYDNKGSFGELALMYNTPRAATIKARTEGVLWAMTRSTFHQIVQKKAFEKRRLYEDLLERVPMLKSLSSYERMNVADALKTRVYQDGDLIIRQGEPGAEMFFIEDGTVRIVMKGKDDAEPKEVAVLKNGGYFGELALLTSHPRAASAYSVGRIKLAVLDVESFERLLGTCHDVLKRGITNYEEKLVEIFGSLEKVPVLRE